MLVYQLCNFQRTYDKRNISAVNFSILIPYFYHTIKVCYTPLILYSNFSKPTVHPSTHLEPAICGAGRPAAKTGRTCHSSRKKYSEPNTRLTLPCFRFALLVHTVFGIGHTSLEESIDRTIIFVSEVQRVLSSETPFFDIERRQVPP